MRRNRREKNEAGNQKYIAIAVLLCMMLLIFCSCGEKATEEEVQEELPEIVVGCNDYSPFCYIGTDGEAAGTDISLAKEAFQRMGYRARFRFIDWGGKRSAAGSGRN